MSRRVLVEDVAAWAPGLETRADWSRWAEVPDPLARTGSPDVGFLPALLRRRCDSLARLFLQAAHDVCPDMSSLQWPTVFASRNGSMSATIGMLHELAQQHPLSPTRFSHSVHNAPAGLFSMVTDDRAASSSVAAGADTFPCALVEALACLERSGADGVLLVMADEPVPSPFEGFADEPEASYAVAFRLRREGRDPGAEDRGPTLEIVASDSHFDGERPPWPLGVELLRACLTGATEVDLGPLRVRITPRSGGTRATC